MMAEWDDLEMGTLGNTPPAWWGRWLVLGGWRRVGSCSSKVIYRVFNIIEQDLFEGLRLRLQADGGTHVLPPT
eukprot:SAG22_NODE_2315_length_2729_cov_75.033080_4_plen_72_part_01